MVSNIRYERINSHKYVAARSENYHVPEKRPVLVCMCYVCGTRRELVICVHK